MNHWPGVIHHLQGELLVFFSKPHDFFYDVVAYGEQKYQYPP
jgi:hypothetical protein